MRANARNPLFLAVIPVLLACLVPVSLAGATDPPTVTSAPTPTVATSSAAKGSSGGIGIPGVAEITDVVCLSGCSKMRTVSPGGTVQVIGKRMASVTAVSFAATPKRIRVKPSLVTAARVEAAVPKGIKSGRVKVISAGGTASKVAPVNLAVGAPMAAGGAKVRVTDASTSPAKAFKFGKKRPRLDFIVQSSRPVVDLRFDVVNGNGSVVRSFFRRRVETGTNQAVAWAGKAEGGKLAPNGAYRFVIRGADGTEANLSNRLRKQRNRSRRQVRTTDPFSFKLYGFIFPLAGSHSYGDGPGAGRGHQGVDIMARCGIPIRAARAGTVYYNDYQAGGAGNYLVINLKGAGKKSHVYMHMPRRSRFTKGAKIKTGQVIGHVGNTGSSTACHLHFEQWSAPGWYQGGTFMNPMGPLKRWDRYS